MRGLVVVACMVMCVGLVVAGAHKKRLASEFATKQLSGPPSEFASHALPSPTSAALTSAAANYLIGFQPSELTGEFSWSRSLYVDSTSGFSFAVLPTVQGSQVALTDPQGNAVDLSSHANSVSYPVWDNDASFAGTQYNFESPVVGEYKVVVTAPSPLTYVSPHLNETTYHGYLILWNEASDVIYSHFTEYNYLLDGQVGLVAQMVDSAKLPLLEQVDDVVTSAELEAIFPDGNILQEAMHDDGLHGDGAANDGVYGASFSASELGRYTVQATLSGTNAQGTFIRTTQHIVNIVPDSLTLTGEATATVDHLTERMYVAIGVQDASDASLNYRAYTQVWGTTASGEEAAACWSSAIVNMASSSLLNLSSSALTLEVDLRWLEIAGVHAPFTLKGVYVQDIDAMVTLDQAASIPVTVDAAVAAAVEEIKSSIVKAGYQGEVTQAMLEGIRPSWLNESCSGGKLIMLHGYCASKNPWQIQASDFSDALFFLNPDASLSHNQYSLLVVEFAEAQGLCSYGLIGHSQGGLVALHTLNYYFSGLDAATGSRKIQSVASPYFGNSAMGTSSDLAALFGSSCEEVYDMTLDGAAAWNAGISATSYSQINYYTVQYDKGGLFGNGWCNMLMNSLISNPNDGATEIKYAQPTVGTNHGNTIGQCHIEGMNWPAAFLDSSRNAIMNSAAAR